MLHMVSIEVCEKLLHPLVHGLVCTMKVDNLLQNVDSLFRIDRGQGKVFKVLLDRTSMEIVEFHGVIVWGALGAHVVARGVRLHIFLVRKHLVCFALLEKGKEIVQDTHNFVLPILP